MISAEEFCTYALDHAPALQLPSSIWQLGRFELSLGPLMLQKMKCRDQECPCGVTVNCLPGILAFASCFRENQHGPGWPVCVEERKHESRCAQLHHRKLDLKLKLLWIWSYFRRSGKLLG